MAETNKQRSQQELKNPDLNYFIAFKIDLTETDKTKIDSTIKKVLSNTGGSVIIRRLLELKNDATEIMCNDSVFQNGTYVPGKGGRSLEAKAAKKFKLDEARSIIEILCNTRKTLLKSEILDICNNSNKPIAFFTEDEFFKEIAYIETSLGVKIIDNIDTQIPFNDFQQADKRLESMGKADLYEFLGVNKKAKEADIESASNKTYNESSKSSDLKKKQNVSDLCARVKKLLLTSPQIRTAYDQYIVIKKDVWDEFSQRKSFGIKEISMEEYESYVQTVIDLLHISLSEAEKIIAIGCKYFQQTIVGKSDGNSFEYCPFCGKLYVKGSNNCPHCGKSLEMLCWNCGQKMRASKDDAGCSSCGATLHAHDLYNQRCQKLDLLLSQPSVEVAELQNAFLDIKNVVPNYSASANSTVAKKVKEYESVINARIKQEETTGVKYKEDVTKIQQLIARKNYQSALSMAKSLIVKYSTYNVANSKKLVSDISVVIQSAQRHVDQANQYMSQGNVALAIVNAAKAIDICDDFSDAHQIMQKYPPKPVSNLRVRTEKNKVRLEWDDNIKQDLITYTVIKKIGIAPTNAEDGNIVDSGLSVKFFEDSSIVSATAYYYAVYVERYGVRSPIAVTQTASTIFSDVLNVQQEVVDGGVKVNWEAPQNVKSVEVWRNAGTVAPLKSGEGTKIEATLNGFFDTKCSGDNAYLIVCNYSTNGKTVQSNGIRSVFKPYDKTTPLSGIKIENRNGNQFVFGCNPDYTGKIKLYYSTAKQAIPVDKTLKYLDFNVICKGLTQIDTVANSDGTIDFLLPKGKIYHVYPIVSTEQLFVVSPPVLINTLDGISNFSHSFSNGILSITGNLHPKAQSIVVRVSNDKYIDKIDGGGEKFTFKAEEFKKNGKIDIKLKSNTVSYVTLFVEFKEDGISSYAPFIQLDSEIDYREKVTVLYSIDYKTSPVKPFKLTLNFEADCEVEIPKLLIMQGSPRPMNKNAGKLCDRIDGVALKKGLFTKKYSAKKVVTVDPVATNIRFAVFLNEESNFIQMKEVKKL